jgi:hypothetical protein
VPTVISTFASTSHPAMSGQNVAMKFVNDMIPQPV